MFCTFGKAKLETSNNDDKYAVIIGISDYEESGNMWWNPDLPLPAKNAIEIKEVLTSHGWEDAEQQGNIHLLLNESATYNNIIDELNWLKEKEGKVLFFFNGHGASIDDDNGDEDELFDNVDEAIVPYDARVNDESTLIRDDELLDIIEDFNANEAVFIFCTCHSGGMIEDAVGYKPLDVFNGKSDDYIRIHNDVVNAVNNFNEGLTNELEGENRVVMSSCGELSLTREFPDGDFLGYIGVPFVSYLIEGLRGYGDVKGNNDGQVSAEEAFEYMKPRADVLNTLAYLKLLTSSPFAIMETLMTAYCLIVVVYVTIATFLSPPQPILKTLLWADVFVLMKIWFDQYGILLPIAHISDYDENNDIQLTESEEVDDSSGTKDLPDKHELKEEIKEQQKVLEEYFDEEVDRSKSTNPLYDKIFSKVSLFLQRFINFFNIGLFKNYNII
jgi:hypothetical protein